MVVPNNMDALEWLRKHLEGDDSSDMLREMVRSFAERLMGAEVDALCGAGYGEVSPERVNSRKWVSASPTGHEGRLDRAGYPEAAGGQLLRRLVAGASAAGRAGAGGSGR